MDVQAWYLRTSKLALALAIIRSKPADKTSKEYAEHLAMLVSEKESTWKSKIEVLEAEVLELRQKLLLSKICLRSCNGGEYVKLSLILINLCGFFLPKLSQNVLPKMYNCLVSLKIKILAI